MISSRISIAVLIAPLLALCQPAGNCVVQGQITDAAGMPIRGAVVHFDPAGNGKAYQIKTGKDGVYQRDSLPEGKYQISAFTADGNLIERKEVLLMPGAEMKVDFTTRNAAAIRLVADSFPSGGPIPRRFTCDGNEVSPSLQWSGEPPGTQSFALIMDDPDAPSGTWNHWLVWDIPSGVHALAEGTGESAGTAGKNDFGKRGYGGPCPPQGRGAHRYFFRLYALDVPSLALPPKVERRDLDKALRPHTLAKAEYFGLYGRN